MSTIDLSRFCILTAPFLHHTLEYALDAIAANDFTSVELWGASPHYCLDDYDDAARKQRVKDIKAMLASRGLSMDVFHPEQVRQYPINIASPSAYIQGKSMDFMRRYLQDAAEFGAGIMMLTPGWVFVDKFTEADTKRAMEAVAKLAEEAKTLGVRLAMEEQDPTTSLLVSTPQRLAEMVKATGIEACMDIPLALSHGSDISAYYSAYPALAHVHLADYGDAGYTALGEGKLDIAALLGQLEQNAYSGKIGLSLWGAIHYPNPDAPLRASRVWLQQHGMAAR